MLSASEENTSGNYLLEKLKIHAEMMPDCVWVDDDFRATNLKPVTFGCFRDKA